MKTLNTHLNGNSFMPLHREVASLVFPPTENDDKADDQETTEAQLQAHFVDAMSRLAQKNGVSRNDIHHLVAPMLRMLRSTGAWVK